MIDLKACIKCELIQPLTRFYKDKTCKDGHVRKCITCYEQRRLEIKQADPIAHLKKTQTFWLKTRYGITLEEYHSMLINQNGKCAICDRLDSGKKANNAFCVDHCHKTGKVRGLLCMPCNRSLGQFNDDSNVLRKAADYIDFHKGENDEK